MNFTTFWFALLFCGLVLARGDGNTAETEENAEVRSCYPDMCDLLKEFGAMTEKLKAMETRLTESETRLMESENQITDLKNKGYVKDLKILLESSFSFIVHYYGIIIKRFCFTQKELRWYSVQQKETET